ncbi:MAG: hypothetical protein Q4G21_03730 [Dermabacter sp.]|nr:hypothetical protein [Dermabacter sp.]
MTTPESGHADAQPPGTPDASAEAFLAHDSSYERRAEARDRWGVFGTTTLMVTAFVMGGVYLYAYAIDEPFLDVLLRLWFPILVGYACLTLGIRPWKPRDTASSSV